jgi:acyl-CoA synthetase (AMP-forming)/AMP-acid ligase II
MTNRALSYTLLTNNFYAIRYRITHLSLIPSVVHQMVNSPMFWKTDLSSVMMAGNGAAYLSPELASKFASKMPNMDRMFEGVFKAWF